MAIRGWGHARGGQPHTITARSSMADYTHQASPRVAFYLLSFPNTVRMDHQKASIFESPSRSSNALARRIATQVRSTHDASTSRPLAVMRRGPTVPDEWDADTREDVGGELPQESIALTRKAWVVSAILRREKLSRSRERLYEDLSV